MFDYFDDLEVDSSRMLRNLAIVLVTVIFWVLLAWLAVRWGWI